MKIVDFRNGLLLFLCFAISYNAFSQNAKTRWNSKDSVWMWCEINSQEIAEAYRKSVSYILREFDLSKDSLKKYILHAEGAIRFNNKRIELRFVHPDVDSVLYRDTDPGYINRAVEILRKDFPNYFDVIYYQKTNKVDVKWSATPDQFKIALEIARPYLCKHLEMTLDSLNIYKINHNSHIRNGHKIIVFDFYDSKHFPEWQRMNGMMGGYPYYFSISIDIILKKVYQLYAFTL